MEKVPPTWCLSFLELMMDGGVCILSKLYPQILVQSSSSCLLPLFNPGHRLPGGPARRSFSMCLEAVPRLSAAE